MFKDMLTNGFEFHHIGVATQNMLNEETVYRILGYKKEGEEFEDPIQGIRGYFMTGGGPRIELLEELDENSNVLTPWLRKGIKVYHVAYEVNDIQLTIDHCVSLGSKVIVKPVPGVAFGGREICFLMFPNLQMVELIQK